MHGYNPCPQPLMHVILCARTVKYCWNHFFLAESQSFGCWNRKNQLLVPELTCLKKAKLMCKYSVNAEVLIFGRKVILIQRQNGARGGDFCPPSNKQFYNKWVHRQVDTRDNESMLIVISVPIFNIQFLTFICLSWNASVLKSYYESKEAEPLFNFPLLISKAHKEK